jgi:anaerobic magnesium-protoporphyrin IX monomethyl ester cyclase
MKILVIQHRFDNGDSPYNPNSREKVGSYIMPLGLAYISTVLKKSGYDVTVLNLNNEEGTVKEILKRVDFYMEYDIAFVGGLSMFYPHIKDIIENTRQFSKNTLIVVGGGIITAQPEIMFKLLQPDYGIIGEGEVTCLELMKYVEKGEYPVDIPGLIFNLHGEAVKTRPREPIMDLDALPFPDYAPFGFSDLLDSMNPYDSGGMYDVVNHPRPYPILASRSCPYNCTFCFHPLGQKYRQRSIDNIMAEIKQNVEKYQINIVTIYDELFSNDKDRVIEFCTKFKAYSDTLPYKLWFMCNCRVDTTTDEMLKIMKQSGAYLLSFGLESYSKKVLSSMKKHITPEQIDNIVHLLRKNELGLMGSFIFGDVAETCETAKETLDYIKNNRKLLGANVGSFFIIPFQGTPLYKQCVNEGKIKDELQFIEDREKNWFKYLEPMNLTSLSDAQFDKLKNEVFSLHLASDTYAYPKWHDHGMGFEWMSVICPSCGKESRFTNMPFPKGFEEIKVGCRNCFFRLHVVSEWYPLRRAAVKLLGFKWIYRLSRKRT